MPHYNHTYKQQTNKNTSNNILKQQAPFIRCKNHLMKKYGNMTDEISFIDKQIKDLLASGNKKSILDIASRHWLIVKNLKKFNKVIKKIIFSITMNPIYQFINEEIEILEEDFKKNTDLLKQVICYYVDEDKSFDKNLYEEILSNCVTLPTFQVLIDDYEELMQNKNNFSALSQHNFFVELLKINLNDIEDVKNSLPDKNVITLNNNSELINESLTEFNYDENINTNTISDKPDIVENETENKNNDQEYYIGMSKETFNNLCENYLDDITLIDEYENFIDIPLGEKGIEINTLSEMVSFKRYEDSIFCDIYWVKDNYYHLDEIDNNDNDGDYLVMDEALTQIEEGNKFGIYYDELVVKPVETDDSNENKSETILLIENFLKTKKDINMRIKSNGFVLNIFELKNQPKKIITFMENLAYAHYDVTTLKNYKNVPYDYNFTGYATEALLNLSYFELLDEIREPYEKPRNKISVNEYKYNKNMIVGSDEEGYCFLDLFFETYTQGDDWSVRDDTWREFRDRAVKMAKEMGFASEMDLQELASYIKDEECLATLDIMKQPDDRLHIYQIRKHNYRLSDFTEESKKNSTTYEAVLAGVKMQQEMTENHIKKLKYQDLDIEDREIFTRDSLVWWCNEMKIRNEMPPDSGYSEEFPNLFYMGTDENLIKNKLHYNLNCNENILETTNSEKVVDTEIKNSKYKLCNAKVGYITELEDIEETFIQTVQDNLNKNRTFADKIHDYDAEALDRYFKAKSKKTFYISGNPNKEALQFLQTTFSQFKLIKSSSTPRPHAVHSNSRNLIEKEILNFYGENAAVFDLGGNFYRHIKNGNFNVHSCFRVNDHEEEARKIKMLANLHNYIIKKRKKLSELRLEGTIKPAQKELEAKLSQININNQNYFCFNSGHECKGETVSNVNYGMSIDSLYDVTMEQLAEWHISKKIIMATHALTLPYDYHFKDEGKLMFNEGYWQKNNGNLMLTFNGQSNVYTNKLENINKLLEKPLHVFKNFGIYVKSEGYRGIHLIVTTYIIDKKYIRDEMINHTIWLTPDTNLVHYKVPIVDPTSTKSLLMSEPFKIINVLINLDMLTLLENKLLAHNFSFNQLLEYARSLKFSVYHTSTGRVSRFTQDVDEVFYHATIAWNNHHKIYASLIPAIKLADNFNREQTYIKALSDAMLNFGKSVINSVDPTMSDEFVLNDFVNMFKNTEQPLFNIKKLKSSDFMPFYDVINRIENGCHSYITQSKATVYNSTLEKTFDITDLFNDDSANKTAFDDMAKNFKGKTKLKKTVTCTPKQQCKHVHYNLDEHVDPFSLYAIIDDCKCCGIKSTLIGKFCYICTKNVRCRPSLFCPHKHNLITDHCCGKQNCMCEKKYLCDCCKEKSLFKECIVCVEGNLNEGMNENQKNEKQKNKNEEKNKSEGPKNDSNNFERGERDFQDFDEDINPNRKKTQEPERETLETENKNVFEQINTLYNIDKKKYKKLNKFSVDSSHESYFINYINVILSLCENDDNEIIKKYELNDFINEDGVNFYELYDVNSKITTNELQMYSDVVNKLYKYYVKLLDEEFNHEEETSNSNSASTSSVSSEEENKQDFKEKEKSDQAIGKIKSQIEKIIEDNLIFSPYIPLKDKPNVKQSYGNINFGGITSDYDYESVINSFDEIDLSIIENYLKVDYSVFEDYHVDFDFTKNFGEFCNYEGYNGELLTKNYYQSNENPNKKIILAKCVPTNLMTVKYVLSKSERADILLPGIMRCFNSFLNEKTEFFHTTSTVELCLLLVLICCKAIKDEESINTILEYTNLYKTGKIEEGHEQIALLDLLKNLHPQISIILNPFIFYYDKANNFPHVKTYVKEIYQQLMTYIKTVTLKADQIYEIMELETKLLTLVQSTSEENNEKENNEKYNDTSNNKPENIINEEKLNTVEFEISTLNSSMLIYEVIEKLNVGEKLKYSVFPNLKINRFFRLGKVELTHREPTVGDGKCGWHALQKTFKLNDKAYDQLCFLTRKTEFYDTNDLLMFAISNNLNLCVLSVEHSIGIKNNESDYFGVILHSRAIKKDYSHFESVNIKPITYCNDLLHSNVLDYELFKELTFFLSKNTVSLNINDYEVDNEFKDYINFRLDVSADLVSFKQKNSYLSFKFDDNLHLEGTLNPDNATNYKSYVKQLDSKVFLNTAYAGFGKSLFYWEKFCEREHCMIVVPTKIAVIKLKESLENCYGNKVKISYNIDSQLIKNYQTDDKPDINIRTYGSLTTYLHYNPENYIKNLMLDEIHTLTPEYLHIYELIIEKLGKNQIGKLMLCSATINEDLTLHKSKSSIKIHEYRYFDLEEILNDIDYINEKTIVVFRSTNNANFYSSRHPHTVVDSKIYSKNPNIFNNNTATIFDYETEKEKLTPSRLYFVTDFIESSVTITDLINVIDTGKRLRKDITLNRIVKNSNIKLIPEDYQWHNKIQARHRVGRTKPGNYYGLIYYKENNFNLLESIELCAFTNIPIDEKYKSDIKTFIETDFVLQPEDVDEIIKTYEDIDGNSIDVDNNNAEDWKESRKDFYRSLNNVNKNNPEFTQYNIDECVYLSERVSTEKGTITDTMRENFDYMIRLQKIIKTKYEKKQMNKLCTNQNFSDVIFDFFKYIKVENLKKPNDKNDTHEQTLPVSLTTEKIINKSVMTCSNCKQTCLQTSGVSCSNCSNFSSNYRINLNNYNHFIKTFDVDFCFNKCYNLSMKINTEKILSNQITLSNFEFWIHNLLLAINDKRVLLSNVKVNNISDTEKYFDSVIVVKVFDNDDMDDIVKNHNLHNNEEVAVIYEDKKFIKTVSSNTIPIDSLEQVKFIVILKEKIYYLKQLILKYINSLELNNKQALFSNFDAVIKKAKHINGVSGSGKTFSSMPYEKGTSVVVKQINLKNKIKKINTEANVEVQTSSFYLNNKQWYKNVVVEEATLFSWQELFLMFNHAQNFTFIYDMNQISHNTEESGLGSTLPLNNYYDKKLTETKRFGQATCRFVKKTVNIDITSKKLDDVVEIFSIDNSTLTTEIISKILVKSGQLDMLITLSNNDILKYKKVFDLPMTTIEKSQGSDYDNVCLIIPYIDSYILKKSFQYTAYTRHKKRLTIITTRYCYDKLGYQNVSEYRKTFNLNENAGIKPDLISNLYTAFEEQFNFGYFQEHFKFNFENINSENVFVKLIKFVYEFLIKLFNFLKNSSEAMVNKINEILIKIVELLLETDFIHYFDNIIISILKALNIKKDKGKNKTEEYFEDETFEEETTNPDFEKNFEEQFNEWCKKNNIDPTSGKHKHGESSEQGGFFFYKFFVNKNFFDNLKENNYMLYSFLKLFKQTLTGIYTVCIEMPAKFYSEILYKLLPKKPLNIYYHNNNLNFSLRLVVISETLFVNHFNSENKILYKISEGNYFAHDSVFENMMKNYSRSKNILFYEVFEIKEELDTKFPLRNSILLVNEDGTEILNYHVINDSRIISDKIFEIIISLSLKYNCTINKSHVGYSYEYLITTNKNTQLKKLIDHLTLLSINAKLYLDILADYIILDDANICKDILYLRMENMINLELQKVFEDESAGSLLALLLGISNVAVIGLVLKYFYDKLQADLSDIDINLDKFFSNKSQSFYHKQSFNDQSDFNPNTKQNDNSNENGKKTDIPLNQNDDKEGNNSNDSENSNSNNSQNKGKQKMSDKEYEKAYGTIPQTATIKELEDKLTPEYIKTFKETASKGHQFDYRLNIVNSYMIPMIRKLASEEDVPPQLYVDVINNLNSTKAYFIANSNLLRFNNIKTLYLAYCNNTILTDSQIRQIEYSIVSQPTCNITTELNHKELCKQLFMIDNIRYVPLAKFVEKHTLNYMLDHMKRKNKRHGLHQDSLDNILNSKNSQGKKDNFESGGAYKLYDFIQFLILKFEKLKKPFKNFGDLIKKVFISIKNYFNSFVEWCKNQFLSKDKAYTYSDGKWHEFVVKTWEEELEDILKNLNDADDEPNATKFMKEKQEIIDLITTHKLIADDNYVIPNFNDDELKSAIKKNNGIYSNEKEKYLIVIPVLISNITVEISVHDHYIHCTGAGAHFLLIRSTNRLYVSQNKIAKLITIVVVNLMKNEVGGFIGKQKIITIFELINAIVTAIKKFFYDIIYGKKTEESSELFKDLNETLNQKMKQNNIEMSKLNYLFNIIVKKQKNLIDPNITYKLRENDLYIRINLHESIEFNLYSFDDTLKVLSNYANMSEKYQDMAALFINQLTMLINDQISYKTIRNTLYSDFDISDKNYYKNLMNNTADIEYSPEILLKLFSNGKKLKRRNLFDYKSFMETYRREKSSFIIREEDFKKIQNEFINSFLNLTHGADNEMSVYYDQEQINTFMSYRMDPVHLNDPEKTVSLFVKKMKLMLKRTKSRSNYFIVTGKNFSLFMDKDDSIRMFFIYENNTIYFYYPYSLELFNVNMFKITTILGDFQKYYPSARKYGTSNMYDTAYEGFAENGGKFSFISILVEILTLIKTLTFTISSELVKIKNIAQVMICKKSQCFCADFSNSFFPLKETKELFQDCIISLNLMKINNWFYESGVDYKFIFYWDVQKLTYILRIGYTDTIPERLKVFLKEFKTKLHNRMNKYCSGNYENKKMWNFNNEDLDEAAGAKFTNMLNRFINYDDNDVIENIPPDMRIKLTVIEELLFPKDCSSIHNEEDLIKVSENKQFGKMNDVSGLNISNFEIDSNLSSNKSKKLILVAHAGFGKSTFIKENTDLLIADIDDYNNPLQWLKLSHAINPPSIFESYTVEEYKKILDNLIYFSKFKIIFIPAFDIVSDKILKDDNVIIYCMNDPKPYFERGYQCMRNENIIKSFKTKVEILKCNKIKNIKKRFKIFKLDKNFNHYEKKKKYNGNANFDKLIKKHYDVKTILLRVAVNYFLKYTHSLLFDKKNVNSLNAEQSILDILFYENTQACEEIIYSKMMKNLYRINEGDYHDNKIQVGYLNYEPSLSRPGNFSQYTSTSRAFTQKLLLRENLRKYKMTHDVQLKYFKNSYFNNESESLIKLFNERKMCINTRLIEQWLIGRKTKRINNSIDKLLNQDRDFIINRINIYEKQENITKGDLFHNYNDILNRLVLWNPYSMTALFAPFFSMLKNRFKHLLKSNVIYAEGYDLNELNKKINTYKHNKNDVYFESDLSKQDRQTDSHSLDFEKNVYINVLGGSSEIIDYYFKQHENTYVSTKYFKTFLPPMRHTGQTTVGFGNIINNMRTYSKFFSEKNFKFLLLLGDDLLSVLESVTDQEVKDLSTHTQVYHNMRSTYRTDALSGIFCQLICSHDIFGNYMIVPNVIRLEDRLRSFYKINLDYEDQFKAKIINFTWMIGKNDQTVNICRKYAVDPPEDRIYDLQTILIFNDRYHKIGINKVEQIYNNMIYVFNNPKLHTVDFFIYK